MIEINWKGSIENILFKLQTEILPINEELYCYLMDNFNVFKENESL